MTLPKRNYTYEWLLRDWYGRDRGEAEIAGKLTRPRFLPESLDDTLQSILPPERLNIIKIQSAWENIAGPVNAKRTAPSSLKDGILCVEIFHPAYRMAVDTPKIKEMFLARIQQMFGKEFCSEIRYVPSGRRSG